MQLARKDSADPSGAVNPGGLPELSQTEAKWPGRWTPASISHRMLAAQDEAVLLSGGDLPGGRDWG